MRSRLHAISLMINQKLKTMTRMSQELKEGVFEVVGFLSSALLLSGTFIVL